MRDDATAIDDAMAGASLSAGVRKYFLPAAGMFLLIHFPARLLAHLSMSRSGLRDYWPHPVAGVIVANLVLLASFVLIEGTLIAYVAASARETSSMEAAFRRACARFPQLLLARILYFVSVAAGLAFFVVPGLVIAVFFSMHAWAVIAEDRQPVRSLSRSYELIRGRFGSTLRYL